MPYIPPHKRSNQQEVESDRINPFLATTSSSNNSFTNDKSNTQQKKESLILPDVDSVESFPTLGKTSNVSENTMNFASSLFTPQPKEEVVKEIQDGWVCIQNKEPRFLFGDRSKYQDEFDDFLDYMEELRLERIYCNILDRYERYEEEDLIRFGEKHIYSWQIDDYLKEQELERKLAQMEDDVSDDESSDDDSTTYEFN